MQIKPLKPCAWPAKLHNQRSQYREAFDTLLKLEKTAPQAIPLAANLLIHIAQSHPALQMPVVELLKAHYAIAPSVDVMEAIVQLDDDPASSRKGYLLHLEREPSLIAASRWIAGESLGSDQNHKLVQRALDQATKPLMRYRCAACGFEATQHFWHCPGCQAWDSYPARRIEEL
jgi:lipopolysaccharide biosynthesis regulator YciM